MKNEKILLFTLAFIQFAHITDFMLMMPLGPLLMKELDINASQFAGIVSIYTISAGIFGFIGAFFLDLFDRKKILLTIFCGFTIGTFTCGMAETALTLSLARAFTGAFGGILAAVILSIIADIFPPERRGQAMGSVMAAFSAASVLGVPIGLYFATTFTWELPYIGLAILCLPILFLGYKYIPSITPKQTRFENPMNVIKDVFKEVNHLRAFLFTFLLMMGHFTIIPFISPYMVYNVGFTEQQLTYIYLLGGSFTIFSSPLIGKLSDTVGKNKVFLWAAVLVVFPLFWISHMTPIPVPLALVATTLFFILTTGRMIPSTALISSAATKENRGKYMSIYSSFRQISTGAAAYVSGLIVVTASDNKIENYNLVGYLAIACTLASILVLRRVKVYS